MKEIVLLLSGVIIGAFTMGLISASSYDKGFEDGHQIITREGKEND